MKIAKTLVNLFLSATILVSTIGIPVNRHYCLDRLESVRLFEKAIPCAMEQAMNQEDCPIPLKKLIDNHKKDCCHDSHDLIKLTNLQNSITHIELAKIYPVDVVTFTPYQSLFNNQSNNSTLASDRSPPLIEPDRTVKYHTFLI